MVIIRKAFTNLLFFGNLVCFKAPPVSILAISFCCLWCRICPIATGFWDVYYVLVVFVGPFFWQPILFPLWALNQSPYWRGSFVGPVKCWSLCPITPQRRQKIGVSHCVSRLNISSFLLVTTPHRFNGLSRGTFTQILMNFSWSIDYDLEFAATKLLIFLPILFLPTSCQTVNPRFATKVGNEWMRCLLSFPFPTFWEEKIVLLKFHGPFVSTHFIWYSLKNLNW